ncbi:MAG: C-terminal target protein [Chryseobacterium sp.]|jgi:hypothetical protein|uniref:Ig-like domain-containing protein n=1 Tax=Chryseobacterium sp. TaxID=1871047 RepID=UPI002604ADB0|nr:fibronectin type III domain-containing protein [Chryseobacterium sp.]MDF2553632.1 C-terminal target protein [Chryseobacterium sp.]
MKHFYKHFSPPKKTRNCLRSVAAGLVCLFTGFSNVNAQVSSYSFAQSSGTFTPITGTVLDTATGNASATNLNSEVYPVTLPFAFIFDGTSYTSLNVSSNGFVTFGATAPSTTNTTPISNSAAYDGSIAAFGRDLNSVFNVNGVTGNISWEVVGTAPNREIVIQWKDFRPTNVTVTTSVYTFSFQVRLQETSNVIKTVYTNGSYVIGSTAYNSTAQVGLRGATNADFNNRLNATTLEFVNSTAGTANNSSQAFHTVNAIPGMPSSGLTYTWTPPSCLRPTSITNPSSTLNSVDVQWVAPAIAPATGYEIYYSTTNTAPTSSTNALITGITGTSATIPSLASSTTYYVWVRSVCTAPDKSEWSLSGIAKTLCGPATSMFENFDSYATGNIVPDCWTRIVGASNTAQTISSTSPASGTRNLYQITSTPANATVVVLPEFSNVSAGTHWLRFKARVASATGSLDVGYITNITDASTFVNIQTVNILNTSYAAQDSEYTVIVPNTVPANARLAIRNSGTSTVGHFYDDVYWEAKPSCISPTNINISNITPTSAEVQWTASVSAPSNGYDIYYSTSDTPPTQSTPPSNTVATGLSGVISPLTPSTKYYVWVRSRCSTTDFSAWSTQIVTFTTLCQPPTITATTGATVCPNNTATLTATSTGSLTWYDAPTAGNVVGTGASFTTPSLTATTPYYVSAATSTIASAALPNAISDSGYTLEAGLFFDVYSSFTIHGVYVYPIGTGAGTVTIALQDGSVTPATTLQSITVNLTGTAAPYVKTYVPLNFTIAPGSNYKLMMLSKTGGVTSLVRESGSTWGNYPLTVPGQFAITNGNCCSANATSTSYYYFYDWQVSLICESARTMVTATVDSGCLSTSETDKKEMIKVYPNPFSEIVNISKPELVKSIRVSDVSGKLIRTFNQAESVLRLNDLSAGMYILQLDMKDGSKQTIKIIKK